jgi:soluble lytic murein transglycosylase
MSHTLACKLARPLASAGRALLLSGLFVVALHGDAFARTPEDPPSSVRAALAAAERGDWRAVDGLGGRLADPVAGKLLVWLRATRGDGSLSFGEIAAFLAANPDWPNGAALLRRAEEILPEEKSARAVVSWFAGREPSTPYGRFRLARAYLELGDQKRAGELARRSWRGGDLYYPDLERTFRTTFASLLSMGDHRARLDALLWDGRDTAARRLYDVVGSDRRALAEARILLRQQKRNADAAVAAVPPALRADPGLTYERIRRLRQKGLEAEARKLLAEIKQDAGRPDLWWTERHALARDALRQGRAAEAYAIARAHALSEPSDYAEAEWLAGWIALRFLHKPEAARNHFLNMAKVVRFPISVARAAYWAGRAGEVAGDKPFAMGWYRSAAAHPTTFYGRLAAERVSPDATLVLPPAPEPSRMDRAAFAGHELVRAARLLAAHGQEDAARTFIRRLGEIRDVPSWQAMTAELAGEIGGTGLGVATAKRAMREGFLLFEQAYPLMTLPIAAERLPHPVEPALVLAMIRQESEFDRGAISSAGARGLMQLMPGTAKQVAASLDLPYSPDRLTRDPAYNVKLGRAYLSKLLGSFDGSVALAFAAYNAGPARVRQWLDTYGDPRGGRVDLIDWIEMLPFAETRNYVQRAIENRWVYQARLNGDSVLLASGLGR